MGFTPAGGFMMGTRSGDLDPGIICYLLNERHFDAHGLVELVNHQSGLLGVSGISSDMKTLLERANTEPDAAMAVQMFLLSAPKANRRAQRRTWWDSISWFSLAVSANAPHLCDGRPVVAWNTSASGSIANETTPMRIRLAPLTTGASFASSQPTRT